jgi:uncharacterized protein YjiS (DUF1127 family)
MDIIAIEMQARTARAEFLHGIVAKLRAAWNERAERREAVAYLSRLTDYELADMGLVRSEIPAAVAGRLSSDQYTEFFVPVSANNAANDQRSKQVKVA